MENKFHEIITLRIDSILKSKKMSARKCCELMGVSSQYLNQILTGGKMLSLSGLRKFCQVTETTLSEFFDGRTKFPGEQLELLKYCNKLSPEEIQDLTRIAKRLAQNKK